jgi:hypothetical protein
MSVLGQMRAEFRMDQPGKTRAATLVGVRQRVAADRRPPGLDSSRRCKEATRLRTMAEADDIRETLLEANRILSNTPGIQAALAGAGARNVYAEPRNTGDVDYAVVVDDEERYRELLHRLETSGFVLRTEQSDRRGSIDWHHVRTQLRPFQRESQLKRAMGYDRSLGRDSEP